MRWFRIVLIEIEIPLAPAPEGTAPLTPMRIIVPSSAGQQYLPASAFRLHTEQGDRPIHAMIGIAGQDEVVPSDWLPLTLDEARALFTAFTGHVPTEAHVF